MDTTVDSGHWRIQWAFRAAPPQRTKVACLAPQKRSMCVNFFTALDVFFFTDMSVATSHWRY